MTEQIAEGEDVEKVIKNGYGFDVKSKQIDKIKDEADKLKDVKDKAKNEDDLKIEKQQGKLQDAIQNLLTTNQEQVGQHTVILAKMLTHTHMAQVQTS